MKKSIQSGIRLWVAAVMVMAFTLGNVSISEAISVRSGSSSEDGLVVKFEPVKSEYKVGEAIKFKLSTNKKVYLYLFSINEESNQGVVILPNKLQQYHVYKPKTEYLVPEKEVEFVADKPGTEKIVMLASTKKLKLKQGSYKKAGDFLATTADTMNKDIKALSIRKPQKDEKQVIAEVAVKVVGTDNAAAEAAPAAPAVAVSDDDPVSVFVSSNQIEYKIGDLMEVTFGADKEGFVFLYSIEPDGKRTLLKKTAVNGEAFYQEKGRVTSPEGQHKLMAVYSEKESLDESKIKIEKSENKAKGFELITNKPLPVAVYLVNVHK